MHYPVPGHQHIEVLVPGTAHTPYPGPDQLLGRTPRPRGMEPVVQQAIDAALGGRDPAARMAASFVPAVRAHIRARKREMKQATKTATKKTPAAEVKIVTCHAREGGEFFGTVDAAGKRRAYVARVENGKLVSFRVL